MDASKHFCGGNMKKDKIFMEKIKQIKNKWSTKKPIKLTKEMIFIDSDTEDVYKYDGNKWVKIYDNK